MHPIDRQIKKLKKKNTCGLMTHLVIGYPTLTISEKLIYFLEAAGSDFIELQIPFSDPVADGPIIMQACEKALDNGIGVKDCLVFLEKVAKKTSVPLLFMAYYNSILRYGVKKFCQAAQYAGASGLIVPDLPPEEERFEHFMEIAQKNNLYPIRVISPASTRERLKKNAQIAKGFVYCVSHYGTTGKYGRLPKIEAYLKRVRQLINLPLALGFGIHKPVQIKKLKHQSDILVVGSGIIATLSKKKSLEKPEKKVYQYVKRLKKAIIS